MLELYGRHEAKISSMQAEEGYLRLDLGLIEEIREIQESLDVKKIEEEITSVKSMSLLNHNLMEQIQGSVFKLEEMMIPQRLEEIERAICVQTRVLCLLESHLNLSHSPPLLLASSPRPLSPLYP